MPAYSQAEFQGPGPYAAVLSPQRSMTLGQAPDNYINGAFMNAYGMQPGMPMAGIEAARYSGYAQPFQ